MPDLFTHFAIGYAASRNKKILQFSSVFILGNILPDIFARMIGIFFSFFGLGIGNYFLVMHTPVGLLLLCYLITMLFEEESRVSIFAFLFSGSLVHILLDLMQSSFYESRDFILFPFSFETFSFHFFYYNDSVYIAPFLIFAFLIHRLYEYRY